MMMRISLNDISSLIVYLVLAAILALWSPVAVKNALSEPGDELKTLTVPVPGTEFGDLGIGFANDCEADGVNLYYTNTLQCTLYKMDAEGNLIAALPLKDSATGEPLSTPCPGGIQWDQTRRVLWGGGEECDANGMPIYTINPYTGATTLKFYIPHGSDLIDVCFTDGISYDASTDSIYYSDDLHANIGVFEAGGSHELLQIITPNIGGVPLGEIDPGFITCSGPPKPSGGFECGASGVLVTKDNRIYIGRGPLNKINILNQADGESIVDFPSPFGRDEDMECDPITFAPLEAIWVKGARDQKVTAFEVPPGTCLCGGVDLTKPRPIPTMSEWGLVATALILFGASVFFLKRRRLERDN